MAISVRRIFKKGKSIMLIAQRNRQTDFSSQKIAGSYLPSMNEVNTVNFPCISSCPCNMNSNIPVSLMGLAGTINNSEFYNGGNSNINYISRFKMENPKPGEVLHCTRESTRPQENAPKMNDLGKAEPEQVEFIYKNLSEQLPLFFRTSVDYCIYHPNLIFENNIKGTKTIGIRSYVTQLAVIRVAAHIKFAKVDFDVLKITAHPEDGTVRVRWRIRGITNLKYFMGFFKYRTSLKSFSQERWIDGFSIFYVRSDGLIHKHIAEKMIPDSEEKACSSSSTKIAAKVAVALGITMKEFSSTLLYEKYPNTFGSCSYNFQNSKLGILNESKSDDVSLIMKS